jgi:hypothetical protein
VIASSSVVISNLAYLIGAVVFAVLGGFAVWWRHRTPKSVQANISSFNRGLRALAPEGEDARPVPEPGVRIEPRIDPRPSGVRTIRSTDDEPRQAEG